MDNDTETKTVVENSGEVKTVVDNSGDAKTTVEKTGDVKTMVVKDGKESFTSKKVVLYVLGVLEALFALRLIFKILGANPGSGFIKAIYAVTHVFLVPFDAIFRSASTEGIETVSVLEPGTIIAMIIYALLAWGIIKLMIIIRKNNQAE